MAQKTLTTSYLSKLANANHDGVTQQIDDRLQAFETENTMLIQAAAGVHSTAGDTRHARVTLRAQRHSPAPSRSASELSDALTSSISSTPTRSDGLFAPISITSMPSEAPTYRLRSPLQASAALLTGQESPAIHPASLLIGQEPCAERPADEHTGHKTTNIRINVKKRNKSYTLDVTF